MKHRFLYIMALLLTVATGAWAQDPDPIDLTPSADGTVWTLSTMPEYDVELEVTYYTDAELDQMAADEVIAKITAIGTVTYTPESKALIGAARTAYDALTAAQQALVTNYSTLTDAETTYADLAAANPVIELIDAIGTVEYRTLAATPAFDVELEVEYETALALSETTDNSAALTEWDGYEADVTLTRTLQAGGWNTLAVPFNADAASLGLSAAKELESATLENFVLTLNFTDAAVIEAGKPYLVKVAENVENPTIAGVIVSKEAVPFTSTNLDFIPTLGATTITGDNSKEVLFLASENKLKNPTELPADIKGFRAYFQLKGEGAQVKAFQLNLGDDEATGIIAIDYEPLKQSSTDVNIDHSVYDLSGRRVANGQSSMVNGQSLKKGVYIVNGKKTIIK